MIVSLSFLLVFVFFWIITAFTQFLQIVAPEFHRKIGFMPRAAFSRKFEWYRVRHRGVAWADMTFALAGVIFVVGAALGQRWSVFFGFYTCAIYFYSGLVAPCEWYFLGRKGLSPVSGSELVVSQVYMLSVAAFGAFGMAYLWGSL